MRFIGLLHAFDLTRSDDCPQMAIKSHPTSKTVYTHERTQQEK